MLLTTISAGAQNNTPVKDHLGVAKKLFNEQKYQESIDIVNDGMLLCNDKTDSLYIELATHKALCYNWLGENKSALELLHRVYPHCNRINQKNRIEYLYCAISYNTDINRGSDFYMECAANMIVNKYRLKKSVLFYKEGLLIKYGSGLESEKISALLDDEKRRFEDTADSFIVPILDFIHAYLLANNYYSMFIEARDIDDQKESIKFFRNAIDELQNHYEDYALECLFEAYRELGVVYESLGYNSAAYVQFKKMLDLGRLYWNDWGYKTPWSSGKAHNDTALGLEKYTHSLIKAKRFQEAIDYCDQVLNDAALDSKYQTEIITKVEIIKGEANRLLRKTAPYVQPTKESPDQFAISLYHQHKLNESELKEIINKSNTLDGWSIRLCDFLYTHNEFKLLELLTTSLIEHFAKQCQKGDDIVALEREEWHYSNGLGVILQMYYYLSLTYLSQNNHPLAIHSMQHAVEIARTDSHYDFGERERILNGYSRQSHAINYIDTEVYMYEQLSYIYLSAQCYEDAYNTYKYATDLNLRILQAVLSTGSMQSKQEEWEKRTHIYHSIIYNLSNYTEAYQPFAKLIMESLSMLKGFMLDYNLNTKESVYKSEESIAHYNNKRWAEKELERSNYVQCDKEELIAIIDNEDIHINNQFDIKSIMGNSAISYDMLQNRLYENDIVVDFFTTKMSIPFIEVKDTTSIIGPLKHSFYDTDLYAAITRKNWDAPIVIKIGKIRDSTQEHGRDLFDYIYLNNNNPETISSLYSDECLGKFIWEKVLNTGQIKNGENIYIIPSNIINRLAVEHLTLDSVSTVSTIYNIHRISSLYEVNKENYLYTKNDRCVAFGDVNYYNDTCTKTNYSGTMNSNPIAILSREQLGSLSSTQSVLNTIEKVIPNTQIVAGDMANEQVFNELSNQSPEIIFIATHGFNYEYSELSDKDKEYIFGQYRNRQLSNEEKGMYMSGLFMAESNSKEITTDGMLTASEVGFCSLYNTKIAVLSACSTATGLTSIDGVYGLQRGFKMAGVKSIIASLWDVDEYATQLLMTEFFKNYTNGNSSHESLKKAQDHVREYNSNDVFNQISYSSPYYWAGFILID